MLLYIDQLHEPQDLFLDIESRQCDLPPDIGALTGNIRMEAHIRRVQEEIAIEGRISAHIEMACSRCLKSYHEPLDDSFEVIYLPQPEYQGNIEEIELEETDLNVSYYHGGTIDLLELAREQLLLLLPVKPLCKPSCAGLCPICGQDLNEGTCQCAQETRDPRLAVLKQLLHSKSSPESH